MFSFLDLGYLVHWFPAPHVVLSFAVFGQGIKNNSQDLPAWFDAGREYFDGFPPPKALAGRSGCNQKSCSGLDSWIEATEVCTGKSCGCRKSEYCEDIKFGDVSDACLGIFFC